MKRDSSYLLRSRTPDPVVRGSVFKHTDLGRNSTAVGDSRNDLLKL
jgi:hypothetical protein